jgi:hypothetical protein
MYWKILLLGNTSEGTERRQPVMTYEKPQVIDFGSISWHTFTTPSGANKGKVCNNSPDHRGEISTDYPDDRC